MTVSFAAAVSEQREYPLWRWGVMFSFAVSSALNGFMFMNFCTTQSLTRDIFTVDTDAINWLYSAALLAVLPTTFPTVYFVKSHNFLTTFCLVACSAWLRYVSVVKESYPVALVSSIVLGLAACAMYCSYTVLAERWFPANERTFATSMGVMSNYFGWCLGGKFTPDLAFDESSMVDFLLHQAIFASLVFIPFLIFHREQPHNSFSQLFLGADIGKASHDNRMGDDATKMTRGSSAGQDEVEQPHDVKVALGEVQKPHEVAEKIHSRSVMTDVRAMYRNPAFIIQGACYSMLGGISFAIPAVQDAIFSELGYTSRQNSWTNTMFLASGVVSGLALGFVCNNKANFPVILITLFVTCTLSLSALAACTAWHEHVAVSETQLYIVLLICMAFSGAASLGFIGIALAHVLTITHPVNEAFSGGALEWFVQVMGTVLTLVAVGKCAFVTLAALQLAITILLVVAFNVRSCNGSTDRSAEKKRSTASAKIMV
eukprot:GEMP01017533.1.p1 GENE.GEMP01017533.1~~GEMP01017533.1.p1  ORF type:complete len:487 (+),score=91.88 GEMP01017533.1:81-1541(+)